MVRLLLWLCRGGSDVAVCSRGSEMTQLEDVADEIRRLGRRSMAIQADTSRKADVERMRRNDNNQFGAVDILVNNAGILIRGPLLEMSEDAWNQIMDVDLKGIFFVLRQWARDGWTEEREHYQHVNTVCVQSAHHRDGAYAIAKAGVVMLTRVLAQELGRDGIRANAIAPGLTRTDFSQATWSNPNSRADRGILALGRIAETSDLIGAALFLASDASTYLTGHTILMEEEDWLEMLFHFFLKRASSAFLASFARSRPLPSPLALSGQNNRSDWLFLIYDPLS